MSSIENSLNKIGGIVDAITDLSEEDIQALEKLIEVQIVREEEFENLSSKQLNKMGDFHLVVLRSLQQIREANNKFWGQPDSLFIAENVQFRTQ